MRAELERRRRLQETEAERIRREASRADAALTDPVAFAHHILGARTWSRQEEIMRAAFDHPRTAVRSGHKVSKSTSAAFIAICWAATKPGGRVILTSSTERQVKGILWREIRRWLEPARERLGLTGPIPLDPATGIQWPDGRQIFGFTAGDAEKMAGFSGEELLFIIDEASGVPRAITETIEGNRAGGGHVLYLSNPTQTSGEFFDAFHTRREFFHTIHVRSDETPNVTGKGEPIPGLATRAWVEEKRREWGEDDPRYQVRVLGNFPGQADNAVIGLNLIEEARARYEETPAEGILDIGVDVARFGADSSVIFPRRSKKLLPCTLRHGLDGIQVAGAVMEVVRTHRQKGEPRARVKVDVIGVGASVYDQLRRYAEEIELIAVNVAEVAHDEEHFFNLRSQLWFGVAEFLRSGGALPEDPALEGDLLAPVYSFDLRGRQKVESKDDIRRRLGRSPDRADGAALAIYVPPVARVIKPSRPIAPAYRLAGGGRGF